MEIRNIIAPINKVTISVNRLSKTKDKFNVKLPQALTRLCFYICY